MFQEVSLCRMFGVKRDSERGDTLQHPGHDNDVIVHLYDPSDWPILGVGMSLLLCGPDATSAFYALVLILSPLSLCVSLSLSFRDAPLPR